jgi:cytosine/adenosine deaminase-related metal-dependent hydrolase
MAGSEAGFSVTPYGEWHTRELELMVEHLGMQPMDVIRSATSINAAVFGWEDEVGTLKPGLQADLLVVDGDPLQDIRVLGDRRRIFQVYKSGQLVNRSNEPIDRRRMAHERGFNISAAVLHRSTHARPTASPSAGEHRRATTSAK